MALLLKKSTLYYRESTSDPWIPFIMSADANFVAFADEYSASATYAVGEYCRYDGDFWRCTTAITTAEAWNSAHWQKTTIGEEIESLKDDLSNKVLYFTSLAVSATTGDITSYSNSAITANHVLAECVFASPSSITTDVTWTTSAGSLLLNGTCTTATTANVVLVKKDN